MNNKPPTKADLARSYRDKYGMEMATKKLARIMYKDHPLLFSGVEAARILLSKIEGKMKHGSGVRVTHKRENRPYNPYKLPESYKEDREPFILPIACNNILLISDLHIPYHDIEAITAALDYGKEHKVNTIFINGDLIDNSQISRFERDMKKRSVKQEFDATKQFLVSLRAAFPNASIYWLKGNHCIRWEKFLAQKVSEIWDDDYFHLEQRLALHEQKINILDDTILVKAGKLSITHGHHIFKGFSSPVNPARGAYLKAKQSLIVGHLHRGSYNPESNLDGEIVGCWSTGCLCELRPNYSPMVSNSQHGFAHIIVDKNGHYTVKNHTIIKGKIH